MKGKLYRGGYSFSQEYVPTTFGVAPRVAEGLVDFEMWCNDYSNQSAFGDGDGMKMYSFPIDDTDVMVLLLCGMFCLLLFGRLSRR